MPSGERCEGESAGELCDPSEETMAQLVCGASQVSFLLGNRVLTAFGCIFVVFKCVESFVEFYHRRTPSPHACKQNRVILPSWFMLVPVILSLLSPLSDSSFMSVDETLGSLRHAGSNILDCIIIESAVRGCVASSETINLIIVIIGLSDSTTNTLG